MRAPTNTRTTSGFTMVELMIAMATMTIVLLAVALATMQGNRAYNAGRAVSDVEARTQRMLRRVVEDLRWAGRAGLFPEPLAPFGSSTVDFQSNVGVDGGGGVIWSTPTRIAFEYAPGELDDGIDNNGNGVVDEGQIVLRRDVGAAGEQRIVHGSWVREFLEGEIPNGADDNGNGLIDEAGLCFEVNGTTLLVRLTLEQPDPEGRLITRTMTSAVNLRN